MKPGFVFLTLQSHTFLTGERTFLNLVFKNCDKAISLPSRKGEFRLVERYKFWPVRLGVRTQDFHS